MIQAQTHPQVLPTSANFLSIVTLIESAMSQLRWGEYTPAQLEQIHAAIDVGYRQPQVTFADYENVRRRFDDAAIESQPRIDLDAFDMGDPTDDEEAEES